MCQYQHTTSSTNQLWRRFRSTHCNQFGRHLSMGKTQTLGREICKYHKRARHALQFSFWRSHASHWFLLSIKNHVRQMHQLFWFCFSGAPKSACDFKCYGLRKGAYFFPLFLDTQRPSSGFYYCYTHTEWSKNKGILPILHSSGWHLCNGLQWGITEHHHAPCCSLPFRKTRQSLRRPTLFAQCHRLFAFTYFLV